MTTTIQARYTDRSIEVEFDAGDVCLRTFEAGVRSVGMRVKPSDLLDAVRSELGVLTINNADLPEVREEHGVNHNHLVAGAVAVQDDDVSDLWFKARSFIAIALHREAHPSVDEQQVEALAELIESEAVPLRDERFTDLARRIIRTGKVTVQS